MAPTISVVINTFNEEKNLPFALGSVRSWVDEIVIVDMYSDDRTVEIARSFGAKVLFHERLGFADPARAFALEQASGDWILMLDADEMIPPPLSRALMKLAAGSDVDVVEVHRLNYFFGTPLMHSFSGPHQDRNPRFFRKGHIITTPAIHNFLHPSSGSRVFDLGYEPGLAIVHFAYADSHDFIEKLDRYTGIEARQAFERGERVKFWSVVLKAAKVLGGRYFITGGFRDGWRGLYVSLLYTFYRIVAIAKLYELTALGGREQIEARYRQEAEKVLKAYGEPLVSLPRSSAGASTSHGRE
jgi:glycosyltransferase involved in cell wall biosynthesis